MVMASDWMTCPAIAIAPHRYLRRSSVISAENVETDSRPESGRSAAAPPVIRRRDVRIYRGTHQQTADEIGGRVPRNRRKQRLSTIVSHQRSYAPMAASAYRKNTVPGTRPLRALGRPQVVFSTRSGSQRRNQPLRRAADRGRGGSERRCHSPAAPRGNAFAPANADGQPLQQQQAIVTLLPTATTCDGPTAQRAFASAWPSSASTTMAQGEPASSARAVECVAGDHTNAKQRRELGSRSRTPARVAGNGECAEVAYQIGQAQASGAGDRDVEHDRPKSACHRMNCSANCAPSPHSA